GAKVGHLAAQPGRAAEAVALVARRAGAAGPIDGLPIAVDIVIEGVDLVFGADLLPKRVHLSMERVDLVALSSKDHTACSSCCSAPTGGGSPSARAFLMAGWNSVAGAGGRSRASAPDVRASYHAGRRFMRQYHTSVVSVQS